MKKVLLLAPLAMLILTGCSPKESYDKPDPAPANNKFDTATDKASQAGGSSNKGQQEQPATDQ